MWINNRKKMNQYSISIKIWDVLKRNKKDKNEGSEE